jgi:hypothetical protein
MNCIGDKILGRSFISALGLSVPNFVAVVYFVGFVFIEIDVMVGPGIHFAPDGLVVLESRQSEKI